MDNIWSENPAYDIDVVFCLDMTGNVQGISQVSNGLCDFYDRFVERFEADGCELGSIRAKFVLFRDYLYDDEPMVESMFFDLGTEMDEALAFANGFYPGGGGDLCENSLEALSIAMDSEWRDKKRHYRKIIVLVTDSTPLPLCDERRVGSPMYPMGMPESFDALREKWDSLGRQKRLFLFAPYDAEWQSMCEWDNVFMSPVKNNSNCCDVDFMPMIVELFH